MKKILILTLTMLLSLTCLFVFINKASASVVYSENDVVFTSRLDYNNALYLSHNYNVYENDINNMFDGDVNSFVWFGANSNTCTQYNFYVNYSLKENEIFNTIIVKTDLFSADCLYGFDVFLDDTKILSVDVNDENVRNYCLTFDTAFTGKRLRLCGVSKTDTNWIKLYEFNVCYVNYDSAFDIGYNKGYDVGYDVGYNNGELDGIKKGENVNASIGDMFLQIIDAPRQAIANILNFEIFGLNVSGLVFFLITAVLVVAIIKFFI